MKKITSIFLSFFLSFFLSLAGLAQDRANRIPESCYPFSSAPDTLFLTSENFSHAEKISLHSLMGILAKTKPQILRDVHNHRSMVQEAGVVVIDRFYQDYSNLVRHFANQFKGYILCKSNGSSANVAISLSSVMNALVVPEEIEQTALNAGLKKIIDVRRKNEKWALRKYGQSFNKSIASYQNNSGERLAFLGDYSVYTGAFQFWDKKSNGSLSKKVYKRMNSGSAFFGSWPDEYKTVEQLSKRSLMVHASDWALNLSVLTNIPVKISIQNSLDTFKIIPGVHTVCFVMSDGDNIQWLLNAFNDTSTWNSNIKSKISLGWTISPALTELAPLVYNRYVSMMSSTGMGRNRLVASPSGRGYYFPSLYPDLKKEAIVLNTYMKKAGLGIVNIIDADDGKLNESVYLDQPDIDALFYYSFGNNYTGRNGKITWHGNKPSIGGRYALWEGANDPQSLAKILNSATTNIYSEDGYSLVAVHVWSSKVNDVWKCVQLLNSNVRVVAPDEFVWLIRKNLKGSEAFKANN